MELHQLRYVIAVAEEGSFTRAAQRLHISQPGVSAQVAQLERELDTVIFRRGGRSLGVTDAGEALIARMRGAVDAVEAVRTSAGELRGLIVGRVRVGAVAGLEWPRVLDALGEFRRRHPGVEVSLREGISGTIQDEVAAGALDLATVSWAGELRADLTAVATVTEQLSVVVSPEHPWAERDAVTPEELLGAEIICMTEGTGMRSAYETTMRAAGLPATVQWEVTLPTTVRALAARGLGVGIVTASPADPPHAGVSVPVRAEHSRSSLGVVRRTAGEPAPAARALLEILERHVASEDIARSDP